MTPSGTRPATGRRALVTGATGFVGSHLVEHLAQAGWEVHGLVRPPGNAEPVAGMARALHSYDGSTRSMVDIVGNARSDVVFHLASLFVAEHETEDVTPLVESNLLLGAQLAEGMRVHGRTLLVNTGMAWQHYGDEPYNPACLYAATKEAFVQLLRFFEESAGLRVITLELYDSYGPGDPRAKLMAVLRRAGREGIRLELTQGEQEIDLVHVRDIARAYALAGERLLAGEVAGHEHYAVRSGRTCTVRELVELWGRLAGRPLAADWGARSYRAREVMRPWSGGRTLPGWQPEIWLEEGIRELLSEVTTRSS